MKEEEIDKARNELLTRLLRSGWAWQAGQYKDLNGIQFTPHGQERLAVILKYLDELNYKEISAADSVVLGELLLQALLSIRAKEETQEPPSTQE